MDREGHSERCGSAGDDQPERRRDSALIHSLRAVPSAFARLDDGQCTQRCPGWSPRRSGAIMRTLIAAAALMMAMVAGGASLLTTAMADPASQAPPRQLAGFTLSPGSALNPGAVPKERNYSIPVQANPCECS